MNSELKAMWKGGVVDCFKILSHHSPEGNEENNERTTFRIAGVLAEILMVTSRIKITCVTF
jgi:hypothetical protein